MADALPFPLVSLKQMAITRTLYVARCYFRMRLTFTDGWCRLCSSRNKENIQIVSRTE